MLRLPCATINAWAGASAPAMMLHLQPVAGRNFQISFEDEKLRLAPQARGHPAQRKLARRQLDLYRCA